LAETTGHARMLEQSESIFQQTRIIPNWMCCNSSHLVFIRGEDPQFSPRSTVPDHITHKNETGTRPTQASIRKKGINAESILDYGQHDNSPSQKTTSPVVPTCGLIVVESYAVRDAPWPMLTSMAAATDSFHLLPGRGLRGCRLWLV
jgi:hypothetical protein